MFSVNLHPLSLSLSLSYACKKLFKKVYNVRSSQGSSVRHIKDLLLYLHFTLRLTLVWMRMWTKTCTQIIFAETAKLISAFVFATWIVQYLFFLNTKLKFQASSHLQWLYSLVCVRPGQIPNFWFSHAGAHIEHCTNYNWVRLDFMWHQRFSRQFEAVAHYVWWYLFQKAWTQLGREKTLSLISFQTV